MASEREGGGERKLNSGWAECCSELGGASSFKAPKLSSFSAMFSMADIWDEGGVITKEKSTVLIVTIIIFIKKDVRVPFWKGFCYSLGPNLIYLSCNKTRDVNWICTKISEQTSVWVRVHVCCCVCSREKEALETKTRSEKNRSKGHRQRAEAVYQRLALLLC